MIRLELSCSPTSGDLLRRETTNINKGSPGASHPSTTKKGKNMKRKIILRAVTLLATALVATLVLGAGKTQRYRVPQDMPLPLYATGLSHTGTNADDWVVTAFYYPSDTIPADYDLFNEPVFAPPVGVVTPLVEGFLVFQDGIPIPLEQNVHNAPSMGSSMGSDRRKVEFIVCSGLFYGLTSSPCSPPTADFARRETTNINKASPGACHPGEKGTDI